jgi:hypothetical protein
MSVVVICTYLIILVFYGQEPNVRRGNLLSRVTRALLNDGILTDIIAQGNTKFSGVVRLNPNTPFRCWICSSL